MPAMNPVSLAVRNGCLILAVSVGFASPGLAATEPAGGGAAIDEPVLSEPQPQPWGTTSDTALVVGASDITPPLDGGTLTYQTYAVGGGPAVYQKSAFTTDWWYQIHVPSGSLLRRVEIEACDTSSTAAINFAIKTAPVPAGPATQITVTATTGVAPTPGCAFFPVTPTATTTINNATNDYWLLFNWQGAFSEVTRIYSIRVYYRLQVSPAPAVATFPNDVPTTHPFFRFVEAMAASGLTGGCGAGSYCPDSPVTRGQMAVFLSSALGLHFPN